MNCFGHQSQLDAIVEKSIPVIIIFVSPQKLIPEQSLLAFFYGYELSKPYHDHIYIWNLIDQNVYEKFQVVNFPQVVVMKGKDTFMSFVGYNRQKSIQAINLLSQELGHGRFGKKLDISKGSCNNKHKMALVTELNPIKYKNGCFHCVFCNMMTHVESDKPIMACFQCNQFHCCECSHQNMKI